nr:hypothetical protein [Desulfobacterales bacterium]
MNKKSGMFEIHDAVLLFGLAGLFGNFLSIPLFLIVLGRTLFASAAPCIVLLCLKQRLAANSKKDLSIVVPIGNILAIH